MGQWGYKLAPNSRSGCKQVPWLVAMTEPNREAVAKRFVERQGQIAYYPLFREIFSDKIVPLFPRYLFVHTNDGIWRYLTNTIGIIKVLIRGEKADLLSDLLMKELRSKERDGIICFHGHFQIGDKVVILGNHVFSGWRGMFFGMKSYDRCRVLLSMLGQEVTVDIGVSSIKAEAA
jgi:transcription antitermination factor NusG